uniref:Protein kinase domain-containing protein n=1 Tax=Megaviridae environmental sample TaxID=1737588 RepID=A0A5J6VK35_9VIRU|nr:MAG: hypothetical protein [Megaviridae environmental sample]
MYGSILQQNYILLTVLGEGATARVWFAYSISCKDFVALKITHADDYDIANDEKKIMYRLPKQLRYHIDIFEFVNDNDEYQIVFVMPLYACNLYIDTRGCMSKAVYLLLS